MVGDRERIDVELADALVARLHTAGLQLHEGLALAESTVVQDHIRSAIDEIDSMIRIVRLASMTTGPLDEDPPTRP